LADQRALAIAGELSLDRWVAGVSGGQPTQQAAESEALRKCQAQRKLRRLEAPCRLYAVGDEVVWRGP